MVCDWICSSVPDINRLDSKATLTIDQQIEHINISGVIFCRLTISLKEL